MDHLEAIVKLDNIIDPFFMDKIICLTKNKAKKNMEVGGGLIKEISVPIIKAYQVPKTVTKTNEKPIFRSSYDAK